MAETSAAPSAAAAVAEPSAPEPSLGTTEYNATPNAVDDLAAALADPEATAEAEVDVAEPQGLQEQETDTVLDKTPSTDALYGIVCQSFDDEKLGARSGGGPHTGVYMRVKSLHQACTVSTRLPRTRPSAAPTARAYRDRRQPTAASLFVLYSRY